MLSECSQEDKPTDNVSLPPENDCGNIEYKVKTMNIFCS